MKENSSSASAIFNPDAASTRGRHLANPCIITACGLILVRGFKSILCFLGILALLLGILPERARAEQYYYGQASTIQTSNCNSSTSVPPGLCQPASACNNGAGPNPDNIKASITLYETPNYLCDGSAGTLTVSGTGTGFRFGATYVSLIYLNGTVSTCSRFPVGMAPTLQNIPNADNDFASMHLGFWVVLPDGSATLNVVKQPTVKGLNNYQTVSVREMQPPNVSCFNYSLDPAPQLNALRACGLLTVTSSPATCN
jgi:hypothetical protein